MNILFRLSEIFSEAVKLLNTSSIGYFKTEFKVIDHIPHMEIFGHLLDSKFAAIPFIPHPFQSYGDPNKAYIYSHAGCIILGPNYYDLPTPYFQGYKKMSELKTLIFNPIEATPSEIMKHAKTNLLWENHSKQLSQAMTKLHS